MPARKYKTAWDPLLAEVGASRDLIALNPPARTECLHRDTSLFEDIWSDWTAIKPRVESLADKLLGAIASPADLIEIGAQALDLPLIPRFEVPDVDLLQAILACGGTPDDRVPELKSLIQKIPIDVAQAAARVIAVLPRAAAGVAQAFGVGLGTWAEWRQTRAPISPNTLDLEAIVETDLGWLAVAAPFP